MLSVISELSWWEQMLIPTTLAILLLYLNMRDVRVIRCDICKGLSRHFSSRSKAVRVEVWIKGVTHKVYQAFDALEVENSYRCAQGHVTTQTFHQELGRKPEARWAGKSSIAMYWSLKKKKSLIPEDA